MSQKKRFLDTLYKDIAARYDRVNRIISLDQMGRLRQALARRVGDGGWVLDACAGTGEVALQILGTRPFSGRVVLADRNPHMLRRAAEKLAGRAVHTRGRALLVLADAEALPFRPEAFSHVVMGFALRNLEDIDTFLAESSRVLLPGGNLLLLDVAHPDSPWRRALFHAYFLHVMPLLGGLASGVPYAYRYLRDSFSSFDPPARVVSRLEPYFPGARYQPLAWGAAVIYLGTKSSADR